MVGCWAVLGCCCAEVVCVAAMRGAVWKSLWSGQVGLIILLALYNTERHYNSLRHYNLIIIM